MEVFISLLSATEQHKTVKRNQFRILPVFTLPDAEMRLISNISEMLINQQIASTQ
jgi:hypothetical protein